MCSFIDNVNPTILVDPDNPLIHLLNNRTNSFLTFLLFSVDFCKGSCFFKRFFDNLCSRFRDKMFSPEFTNNFTGGPASHKNLDTIFKGFAEAGFHIGIRIENNWMYRNVQQFFDLGEITPGLDVTCQADDRIYFPRFFKRFDKINAGKGNIHNRFSGCISNQPGNSHMRKNYFSA